LVGGTTASAGRGEYGDTGGAGVDETRGKARKLRKDGKEERQRSWVGDLGETGGEEDSEGVGVF
jgi:hypothetical protein